MLFPPLTTHASGGLCLNVSQALNFLLLWNPSIEIHLAKNKRGLPIARVPVVFSV